jgi:hypothetical protein
MQNGYMWLPSTINKCPFLAIPFIHEHGNERVWYAERKIVVLGTRNTESVSFKLATQKWKSALL